MRSFLIVVTVVSSVAVGMAQAPPPPQDTAGTAPRPAFEVASVRRNPSGGGRGGGRLPDTGMVTITNATIRTLIALAYQVNRFTLIDASSNSLVASDGPTFDIQAKPPDDAAPGQQRLMLQRLLADRFNLRTHWEQRAIPVYALTVAREGRLGPDLLPTNQDCQAWAAAYRTNPQIADLRHRNGTPLCGVLASPEPDLVLLRDASPASAIAQEIQAFVDRPVIDATGLIGNFEWTLSFARNALNPDHPSIFTAVEEQLGLRLEPRTAPYEVLVVDSVELPTPN
jgi:uncharacterized protein (TIGR03435 family)